MRVALVGDLDAEFASEIASTTTPADATKADIVFLAAADTKGLAKVPKLARSISGALTDSKGGDVPVRPARALWIVYPKGIDAIREGDVIAAGRAAGLTDVKVVRFSDSHTALKFVPRKTKGASPRAAGARN
jgi:hypothetical protein